MKNALKVLIFTVAFIAVAAGVFIGSLKYNRTDFTCSDGGKKGTTVINAYTGSSVNIVIPEKIKGDTVVTIGSNAFERTNIKSLIIPDCVTRIEPRAFNECTKLETVTIGNSVTVIANSAFLGCSELKEINIPASVEDIGEMAFAECKNLKEIKVAEGAKFVFEDGILFTADKKEAVAALPCVDFSTYKFPAETEKFAPELFFNHSELKSFEFPDGTTAIPEGLFTLCSSLEDVKIPDGTLSIGDSAFLGCKSLSKLYIPSSVRTIGKIAFPAVAKGEKIQDSAKEYYNPDFKLIVEKNSYAYHYAVENKINYEFAK